jgi:hypothetical protein
MPCSVHQRPTEHIRQHPIAAKLTESVKSEPKLFGLPGRDFLQILHQRKYVNAPVSLTLKGPDSEFLFFDFHAPKIPNLRTEHNVNHKALLLGRQGGQLGRTWSILMMIMHNKANSSLSRSASLRACPELAERGKL